LEVEITFPRVSEASSGNALSQCVGGLEESNDAERESRPISVGDPVTSNANQAVVSRESRIECSLGTGSAKGQHTFTMHFARMGECQSSDWGFHWSKEHRSENSLVIFDVIEGSVLDKWNFKRRTLGDIKHIVFPGDCVVSVNGDATVEGMLKTLHKQHRVSVEIARGEKAKRMTMARLNPVETFKFERSQPFAHQTTHRPLSYSDALSSIFTSSHNIGGNIDPLNLTDCLENFTRTQAVNDSSSFHQCYDCKNNNSAGLLQRRWLLPSLPPLFLMQLKRFHVRDGSCEKLSEVITLPAELNLQNFCVSEQLLRSLSPHLTEGSKDHVPSCGLTMPSNYELCGVCVHHGTHAHCGHYVAYVNCGPSLECEDWFCIDDESVQRCSRECVLKEEAYIAFFRRTVST